MNKSVELKSRRAALITGYIEGVDRKPRGMGLAEPIARLAIAFNKHYPEFKGGHYFDFELIAAVCTTIIGSGSAEIAYQGRVVLEFQEILNDWRKNAETDDPDDPHLNEIFSTAEIKVGNKVTRVLLGTDFHRTGGPEPYHDSVTLEVYMPESDLAALKEQLRQSLTEFGCKTTEIQGSSDGASGLLALLRGLFRFDK